MAAKKTVKKTSKKDQPQKQKRAERILPKQAPQPVPGTPQGKCAFPKGWTAEHEINSSKAKACGRATQDRNTGEARPKGRWCQDHGKEVRYYQLALNNETLKQRIEDGEAGHYYWRDGRPTLAALTSTKLLNKAREQARAKGLKDAEIERLIKQEMKYLETNGARSNPSVKPDEKGTLRLVSPEIDPVQTRNRAEKPAPKPKAPKKAMTAADKPAKKAPAAKAKPSKAKPAPKKATGSKSPGKSPEPTPKATAPAPRPVAPPPAPRPAGKPIGAS